MSLRTTGLLDFFAVLLLFLTNFSNRSLLVAAANEECGKQANNTLCPLNVCCSQYGFCGIGPEFCDASQNCQSNCVANSAPVSPWNFDVRNTVIGYFETWAADRGGCGKSTASSIALGSMSHINAAFGYIKPTDYTIYPIDGISIENFKAVANLKTTSPGTRIWLSLGGWTFSDNDTSTQAVWGDLSSTAAKRAKFIGQLEKFMVQWGFDGVDLDWEYPSAPDRRGNKLDSANYLALVQDVKTFFDAKGLGWGLSFTAPASYWYLKFFDVARMARSVDFINLMTYDMHGSWDDRSNWIGPHIYTHTNMTEIKQGLELLWRNGVPASKINMGLAFYGRTYKLKDANCATPGCEFIGPGSAGSCTKTDGYMSYREIKDLLKANNVKPYYDKETLSKYVRYSNDQWMSFDDPESIKAKVAYANSVGLRGLFIWAVNQDTEDHEMLAAVMGEKGLGYFGETGDGSSYNSYKVGCTFSECEGSCGVGTVSTASVRCPDKDGKKRKSLCCPIDGAPDPDFCTWRGGGDSGGLCNTRSCQSDEIQMASDPYFVNSKGEDAVCFFSEASYCCKKTETGDKLCDWKANTCVSLNNGNLPNDACGSEKAATYRKGPCSDGKVQPYCCNPGVDTGKASCHWVINKPQYPTTVICDKGTCGQGEIDLGQHEGGGGAIPCLIEVPLGCPGGGFGCSTQGLNNPNKLTYYPTLCCNANALSINVKTLPVPVENIFFSEDLKKLPSDAKTDFDILTDPSMGGQQSSSGSGDPNSASFAWHIIDGPPDQVSSLNKRDGSHWELYDCDPSLHDGLQTAKMVCTDDSTDSNCGDIYNGGAEGTVVRMPKGCGPGKYAMVVGIKKIDAQAPAHLRARNSRRGVRSPHVYELTFDFDFSVLQKRGATNVLLRIDYSDNPGYWNEIVAAKPDKRRELHENQQEVDDLHGGDWHDFLDHHYYLERRTTPEHELHELHARWFSITLDNWIQRMKKVEVQYTALRHKISNNFPVTVFDEERVCQIGPVTQTLRASLKANLRIDIETSAQLTIMGNLGDLRSFSQSHVTLRNKGSLGVVVDFQVFAELRFGSINNELASLAPLGASVVIPGIVTIGPQFKLLGGLTGKIQVHANAQYAVTLAAWDFAQSYPFKTDKPYDSDDLGIENDGNSGARHGVSNSTLGSEFSWDGGAAGSVEIHLTPQVTLGVVWASNLNVPNAGIDFGVHTYGRMFGEVSASSSSSVSYCYGIDAGYEVYVRANAPNLFPGLINLNRYWTIKREDIPVLKSADNCRGAQRRRDLLEVEQFVPYTSGLSLGLEPEFGFVETIDKQ